MDKDIRLIVGLGNPGPEYENTRHNIGFRIVIEYARKLSFTFRKRPSVSGMLAQGEGRGKELLLLLPLTYMNRSGLAVKASIDEFHIAPEQVLVISDDTALPLGRIRLKKAGRPGGHKGLTSVEAHLGTHLYPRMRIGIGEHFEGNLEDYVLGRFSLEEMEALPTIVERAHTALDLWLSLGIETAMQWANVKKEETLGE